MNSVLNHLSIPDIGTMPKVNVDKEHIYDGLDIEELSWEFPYGQTTKAIFLRPSNSKERIPGILAFYDRGLQKYFDVEKNHTYIR